jgi:hypothetical protein
MFFKSYVAVVDLTQLTPASEVLLLSHFCALCLIFTVALASAFCSKAWSLRETRGSTDNNLVDVAISTKSMTATEMLSLSVRNSLQSKLWHGIILCFARPHCRRCHSLVLVLW